MESLEAGVCGEEGSMNSLDEVRIGLVLSMYQRSVRTGHHSLSSLTEKK